MCNGFLYVASSTFNMEDKESSCGPCNAPVDTLLVPEVDTKKPNHEQKTGAARIIENGALNCDCK